MREVLQLKTKAKINLCLHIDGRNQSGYHLLQSIVAFCDVGDLLEVAPAAELSLEVKGEFAAHLPIAENIVLKAAQALSLFCAIQDGAHIILHKNLPPSSGIGGGSGDAAAALKLLNALWNCGLSAAQLAEIGLQIGADVPVCLYGQSCKMAGIGEIITPLPFDCAGLYALLINPLISISTADIFAQLSPSDYSGALVKGQGVLDFTRFNRNDLQATAIKLCPEIASIIAHLQAQPQTLLARMSGSGATCFALCKNAASAHELHRIMHIQFPNYWLALGALS